MTTTTVVQKCCGKAVPADRPYDETKCGIGHCVSLFCRACGSYLLTLGAERCPCKTRTCHG